MLERLKGYDKEAITEDLISKLRPFIEDDDFQPHIVKNASKACEAMCKWAHAMYRFYHVNKQVEPVR